MKKKSRYRVKMLIMLAPFFLIKNRTQQSSPEYHTFLLPESSITIISQRGGTVLSRLAVLF